MINDNQRRKPTRELETSPVGRVTDEQRQALLRDSPQAKLRVLSAWEVITWRYHKV